MSESRKQTRYQFRQKKRFGGKGFEPYVNPLIDLSRVEPGPCLNWSPLFLEVNSRRRDTSPQRHEYRLTVTMQDPWAPSILLDAERVDGDGPVDSAIFPERFMIRVVKSHDPYVCVDHLRNEIDALWRLQAANLEHYAPQMMAALQTPPAISRGILSTQDAERGSDGVPPITTWIHTMSDPAREAGPRTLYCVAFRDAEGRQHQTVRQWRDARDEEPISPGDWLDYVRAVTESLRFIHRERVTHGYLSPDNVLLAAGPKPLDSLFFTNFERPLFLASSANEPDARVESGGGRWRRSFDSPEVLFRRQVLGDGHVAVGAPTRPNATWFATTDIFSLGLHLLYLLVGEHDLPTPWDETRRPVVVGDVPAGWHQVSRDFLKTNRRFKQQVFEQIVKRYAKAPGAGPTACVAMTEIIFAYTRIHESRRLTDLAQIRETVDHFGRFIRPPAASAVVVVAPDTAPLREAIESELMRRMPSFLESAKLPREPLLGLLEARVRQFVRDLPEKFQGEFPATGEKECLTIRGGRLQIIDSLLSLILPLDEQWTIDAVTGISFWLDENLGAGRVASSLMIAALRRCRVRWRLVLSAMELNHPQVTWAMQGLKYVDSVVAEQRNRDTEWDWKWVALPPTQYDEFARKTKGFIRLCLRSSDTPLYIAPDYQLDGGRLTLMRVWNQSDRFKNLYAEYFGDDKGSRKSHWFKSLESYPQRPVTQ